MGSSTDKTPKWIEIGRSTTSPVANKQRKEISIDEYYVVVGFEVNEPVAFVDDTQDLAVDFGHAFFYVVKNHVVTRFFSFGPAGAGDIGWFNKGDPVTPNKYDTGAVIKDGYKMPVPERLITVSAKKSKPSKYLSHSSKVSGWKQRRTPCVRASSAKNKNIPPTRTTPALKPPETFSVRRTLIPRAAAVRLNTVV